MKTMGYEINGGICAGISGTSLAYFFHDGNLTRFNKLIRNISQDKLHYTPKAITNSLLRHAQKAKKARAKGTVIIPSIEQKHAAAALTLFDKISLFQGKFFNNFTLYNRVIPQYAIEKVMYYAAFEEEKNLHNKSNTLDSFLIKTNQWTNCYTKKELILFFENIASALKQHPHHLAFTISGPLEDGLHVISLCYNHRLRMYSLTDSNQQNEDDTLTKDVLRKDTSSIVDFIIAAFNTKVTPLSRPAIKKFLGHSSSSYH